MRGYRWTSWLVLLALVAQANGMLRGMHVQFAHGGDASTPCHVHAHTDPEHVDEHEPESPDQDEHDNCQLCLVLARGLVFSSDLRPEPVLPLRVSSTIRLANASRPEQAGVIVLRARGPPTLCV